MGIEAGTPEDIWRLHDYLTEKREETDDKYDYRYSTLLLLFPRLIREGWMKVDDLEGLSEDKIAQIERLVNM